LVPASIAGLPGSRATVGVGPPLSWRAPSFGSAVLIPAALTTALENWARVRTMFGAVASTVAAPALPSSCRSVAVPPVVPLRMQLARVRVAVLAGPVPDPALADRL
jgi:hypothetical protein